MMLGIFVGVAICIIVFGVFRGLWDVIDWSAALAGWRAGVDYKIRAIEERIGRLEDSGNKP